MPFDRDNALRKAEKLLRQGRLDAAIAQYVRVVDDQPRDWATVNALGDLYVRAGQSDRAAAQYARMADHFVREGFLPKAAALYKKIVKIRPEDETAQLQLAEVSARQGLLADAKSHFLAVAERRRARGDARGAEEVLVRLGTLDPGDYDARRGSARVLGARGDRAGASARLRELAADLAQRGRDADALDILREIVTVDPGDLDTQRRLGQLALAGGDLETARRYLTLEVAQSDPTLLLASAGLELRADHWGEARQLLAQALAIDPASRQAVEQLGVQLIRERPEAAFVCVDVLADAACAVEDWTRAAEVLHLYVSEVSHHVPALMKLIEVCVDGGFETTMLAAQAQLAEAHLAAGRAAEARVIAEDLIAHDPGDPRHDDLLRRARLMLGDADQQLEQGEDVAPEGAATAEVAGDETAVGAAGSAGAAPARQDRAAPATPVAHADVDLEALLAELERVSAGEEHGEAAADAGARDSGGETAGREAPPPAESEEAEIDLTAVLDELIPAVAPPAIETGVAPAARPGETLDTVFDGLRERAARDEASGTAAEHYKAGVADLEAGRTEAAIKALEVAVRSPHHRFDAARRLARICRDRGGVAKAIEWLERAAEAPAPNPDEAHALLYELGDTLAAAGEPARALAVFLELQADAEEYRDVRARVEQLSRVQAGG